MSIKFNIIERRNPLDPSAANKFYASSFVDGKADIEVLTRRMEQNSTVSGADIRAVLYSLTEFVPELLSDGKTVRIGDLGSFRISLSSEGSDTAEEVDSHNIRGAKILFTPGKKLKEMLGKLSYTHAG